MHDRRDSRAAAHLATRQLDRALVSQELVYQSIGDKVDYDEVTAKIRSVVSNLEATRTPTDVGKVDHEFESENLEDDVAAECLGCGGWSRLRRECPSVANDGEGGQSIGQ